MFASCAHRLPQITDLSEQSALNGWRKWQVQKGSQRSIDVYGVLDGHDQKPVLIMIQGSKCLPLFRTDSGKLKSPLFIVEPEFFQKHHVHAIAIERRGIRSFEEIPKAIAEKDRRLRCSEEYGGLTKDERVEDVVDAVEALSSESWFGDVMIIGHSEGVDVATAVANKLKQNVRAVGLLSGATPSTLFDFVVLARKAGKTHEIKDSIETFFWLSEPEAKGKFGGYPIKRIRSFAVESDPLADSLKSTSPLFVVNGTLDPKASVEAADFFVFEVLRKQPDRIVRYMNYASFDHDLVDSKGSDKSAEVFSEFIEWSLEQNKKREFILIE